jgi:hypothetical protein
MLQKRFWINNPDDLFVGGRNSVHDPGTGPIGPDPAMLHEVRMRLQFQLATGGFVTVGENIADLDPDRIRLLTLVLPPYGQAARPLDLFIHVTPEIYDLSVKRNWDQWHVLMLQNWDDYDKTYSVRFADLGLEEEKVYLVFSFWNQMLVGEFRGGVDLRAGARQGETYAIREVPGHPWVLSTDLHLTQGGVELEGVKYEESSEHLEGEASRHTGAKGQVVIYVPQGYKIQSASGTYRVQEGPLGAQVAYLQLEFEHKTSPWWMRFERVR